MNMTIEVTAEHISKTLEAGQGYKAHCAIALAIADEYPTTRHVIVDRNEIRFTDRDAKVRYTYHTPPRARKFVDAFDMGRQTRPFTVQLTDKDLIAARAMIERPASSLIQERRSTGKPKTGVKRGMRSRMPTTS